MDDGTWMHKPGKLLPTDLDAEGKVITDPRSAARDYTRGPITSNPSRKSGWDNWKINYNLFVGFYYVPEKGLAVATGTLPDEVMENPSMRKDRLQEEALARLFPNRMGGIGNKSWPNER